MDTFKDKLKRTSKIFGDSVKKYAEKATDYAKEKHEKYGIEDWDEERILYELRKTNDFFEKRVLTQKLEEVRSNDEED